MLDPMRPDNAAVAKAELAPPFRPKFLHYGKHQQRSAAMQAEMDAIVTSARGSPEMKGSPGGDGPKAATGFVAPMGPTGLQAVEATEGSSTALEHGATGRRGADGGGRITALPESQKKFAWGSERIAHELVCKFVSLQPLSSLHHRPVRRRPSGRAALFSSGVAAVRRGCAADAHRCCLPRPPCCSGPVAISSMRVPAWSPAYLFRRTSWLAA